MADNKVLAADYLNQFYQNVLATTDVFAAYVNLQRELKVKYGAGSEGKLSDDERASYLQAQQLLNQQIIRTNIQFKVLVNSKKIQMNKDVIQAITNSYNVIKQQHVITEDAAEEYVENINMVIVESTMQSLLESSQSLLSQLNYEKSTGSSIQY